MSDRGRSPGPSGQGSSGSRLPSRAPQGSAPGSRTGSPSRSGQAAAGWVSGPGYDPAKPATQPDKGNTRMELPPDAYVTEGQKDIFALRGNKFNTEGSNAVIEVNQYRMKKFDFAKKIYQYDVRCPVVHLFYLKNGS